MTNLEKIRKLEAMADRAAHDMREHLTLADISQRDMRLFTAAIAILKIEEGIMTSIREDELLSHMQEMEFIDKDGAVRAALTRVINAIELEEIL